MESGKYNLRTRPAPISASRSVQIRPSSPVFSEQGSVMGAEPREEYPRTYSDVVASRPGSPARKSGDSFVMPVGRGNTRADRVANESV